MRSAGMYLVVYCMCWGLWDLYPWGLVFTSPEGGTGGGCCGGGWNVATRGWGVSEETVVLLLVLLGDLMIGAGHMLYVMCFSGVGERRVVGVGSMGSMGTVCFACLFAWWGEFLAGWWMDGCGCGCGLGTVMDGWCLGDSERASLRPP
ncbi:hypothetical protein BO82DRAFT_125203 [Aspergillus uvarum CBS 121591]|uniref:Uncharacterized protein n=1 Tax=Aspergillus uvarum CBS 121591 TaxID=1448315 RepID=A0A319CMI1_9EURO|nr:hypothetical protein BO82DRAFT_125203 [Aspergillus uvarum CBS 121591]PYH79883.1 hypothetical protein BO82DRAFT_125203 [Aspergillus uvarum CBS 121591]